MALFRHCPACDGYLPRGALTCPHCDAAVVRALIERHRGLKWLNLVGGSAVTVTLMACYGGGAIGDAGCFGLDEDDDTFLDNCVNDNVLDCDDTDPRVHPYADDPAGDGVDQNCDGVDGVLEDLDAGVWDASDPHDDGGPDAGPNAGSTDGGDDAGDGGAQSDAGSR